MCIRDRFEDGKAAALANLETSSGDLILREELMASKARERELENAIKAARSALNAVSYTHLDVYKRQPRRPCLHELAPQQERRSAHGVKEQA